MACQAADGTITSWRGPNFCPMKCPPYSQYKLCTNTCESTCAGILSTKTCTNQCFEGCECDPGYVLDGDKCVTMDKCGCVFNGKYMRDGDSVLTPDCTKFCKCQAGGVTCSDTSCGTNEKCSVHNGIRGCFSVESDCLVSSRGIVTFDGLSSGPIPPGPLEISSLCDTHSDIWFRIIADIQSCKNDISVARVHVFFQDAFITVSKEREAWLNGLLLSLPAREFGMISISATESNITIDSNINFRLHLSTSGSLKFHVPSEANGQLCGACGNFNDNSLDDLHGPGGVAVGDISTLLLSWRARDFSGCDKPECSIVTLEFCDNLECSIL
ncbi:hypothetical protein GDO86_012136 [Hymenochirus boettgeri]|uniref:VWFD domain-containing protein n=1 Tax=Hymenochirus boettgeri TaxID=247094 RepID=A0A8T2ITB2_9PIPI|nr:hypothetical protein GDO86_012136 [Hymenochirus boettgeri]